MASLPDAVQAASHPFAVGVAERRVLGYVLNRHEPEPVTGVL